LRQGAKYCFAVLFVRADENVQVFGCAWLCMNTESVTTYDEILNSVIVEGA
jgi:hypothetical protein